MTNKTKKRIRPMSLAAALSVVAMLAVLAAVMWPPGAAQAQQLPPAFPPGKPTGLTLTVDSATQISLSWTHVGLAADRYDVERKSSSGAFTNVGMPTTTSYPDTSLTASTEYTYRVRAVNRAGNGSWSDEKSATTMASSTGNGGTSGGDPTTAPTEKCEVRVSAAGALVGGSTLRCSAQGDTAEVVFVGPAAEYTGDADGKLSLLIGDPSGPISAYPNGTAVSAITDGSVTSMRYRYQSITVPEGAPNPTTGVVEGQKVTVTAKGNVYVWVGTKSVTAPIKDTEGTSAAGARQIADSPNSTVAITFLGAPAIGKDGGDINKKVDDDVLEQCESDADATMKMEGTNASTCPNGYSADADAPVDMAESRSKLEADDAAPFVVADASVLDGKSAEITLTENESAVAIQATIKDAKGQSLGDVEVEFAATSVPAGIENRTRSDDTDASGTAEHVIEGLPTDKPYRVTVVVTAGEDNPLTVGTIVIARAGDLDTVTAEACAMVMTGETDTKMDKCMTGYNPKTIYGPGNSFSIHAKAVDERGTKVTPNPFVVRPATAATWWDTLGCVEMNDAVMPTGNEPAVGPDDSTSPYCKMYAGLSAEAKPVVMRAFGDAYGDATDAFNITAAGTGVPPNGMLMLTVEDDAPGARYLLDVVGTAGPSTKRITKSDQVMVIVSGKLDEYMVDGPKYIALNGSGMYTIKALDKNGNPPIFDADKNKVRVLVQPNTLLVTNLTAGELTLDENTGMGEFTVYAPLGAADGDPGRIIIGSGSMQVITNIFFGEVPPEMTAPGMPMKVMAMAEGQDMIKVTWDAPAADGHSAITGYMVQSAHMMADGTKSDWMGVDPAHMGMERMYTDMGLMPGTKYYYRVAAMNAVGMGEYSDGMAMAMTEMMPVLGVPGVTGAMSNAAGMATISIMPAANADKHYVWAFPTDHSDGMYSGEAAGDATSVTMSGLTSGKSYWFTVVAGMDMDDGTTEWAWATAWTGATAIQ